MKTEQDSQPESLASAFGAVDSDQAGSAQLRFERTLPHPPERVWQALTDPEQLRQWYMAHALIDGRPAGSVDMMSGPARFHVTGRILFWEPPRIFEYEWNVEPRAELPQGERSVVRWELTPSGSHATRLVLTHRRLTAATANGFAPGTHAFLDRLTAQLAGSALPNWMQRYGEVQHGYPRWSPS
jgi:uncharacterized protein YndB with AHSA1/START domain